MIQSLIAGIIQQPRKWVLVLLSGVTVFIIARLLLNQQSSGGNNSIANTHFFRKLKKSKEPTQTYSVMVTGGAGFIGSHIVEHFIKNEPLCNRIVIYDNLHSTAQSTGNPNVETNSNLEMLFGIDATKKVVFVKASIMDREKFRETLREYRVRFIYHLAALISVPESMANPKIYFDINTIGTDIVLDEARKTVHVKKVILSSSAAIYGFDPTVPKMENMIPSCESPYAQSKYDGEFLCKFHTQQAQEGVDISTNNNKDGDDQPMVAIALRYFNVFGERQDPNSQYAAAIPRFIDKACKQNEAIEVFGDGRQTRDFVYVKDVVWANVYASFHIGEFGVFNVGYGSYITINELADLVESECAKLSSKPIKKRMYKPKRSGDVSASMASVRRLTNNGWSPKYNFKESAIRTIQYFYNQGRK